MELKFTVAARIARPPAEVFEAIADPERLSAYFTTGGASARLEQGKVVTWSFHDYPGEFPVEVVSVEKDRRIVLRWEAAEGEQAVAQGGTIEPADYQTEVAIMLSPIDSGRRTLVEISEEGWRATQGGLGASYGNCHGWTQMLCSLKAWIEHGIRLREGFYA